MNLEALMEKWGTTVFRSEHIFTFTERESLAFLCEKASAADFVVEVGTYLGRSAKVMLDSGCGHLWAVDLWMVPGTLETTRYFLRENIERGQCELIQKRSDYAAAQLDHMKGKLSMVFLDDGHAHEDLILDITSWLPMLKPGGLLCGHDYETNPENDVTRAVKELLPGHSNPLQRLWAYVKP